MHTRSIRNSILFWAAVLWLCLHVPTVRAQLANLPTNCISYSEVVEGPYPFYSVTHFICVDPLDIGPSCPDSTTTGSGGPTANDAMTHVYNPGGGGGGGGGGNSVLELANLASGPEGASAVESFLNGAGGGGDYAMTHGGGCGSPRPGNYLGAGGCGGLGGPGDPMCCEDQGGMPYWWVNQPNTSLFITDKPFFYNTSRGRQLAFKLHYKGNPGSNGRIDSAQPGIFSVGTNWHTPWRSYLQRSQVVGGSLGVAAMFAFLGDGSARQYHTNSYENSSRARLDPTGEDEYTLTFASGSKNVYGLAVTLGTEPFWFLTKKVDPHGNETTFQYITTNSAVKLSKVTDPDGLETTFVYANHAYYANLLVQVNGPHGLTNVLQYDANARLTNITDVIGLPSGIEYDTNGRASRLVTPYGANTFTYLDGASGWSALRVEELSLRRHLYLEGFAPTNILPTASDEAAALESYLDTVGIGSSTLENNSAWFDQRNTFYWGPRQFENLPSGLRNSLTNGTFEPANLTTNDFRLGTTRHWLRRATPGSTVTLSDVLSLQRDPSPDASGATEGLLTWYDYAEKGTDREQAPEYGRQPSLVAYREPGGDWRVTHTAYNLQRNPLVAKDLYFAYVLETMTPPLGIPIGTTSLWREHAFAYAANGLDMITHHFNGVLHESNAWNDSHQVITNFNAMGEESAFEYNANHQLIWSTNAGGLIMDYGYTGGFLSSVVQRSATTNFSTHTFTWTNGYLHTRTDACGLAVTNVWDALGRLTKAFYPDGTGFTNFYHRLDLVETHNRLGFTNGYAYNGFGQLLRHTNALGRVGSAEYCNCGSLESFTDAATNTTNTVEFTYDNLGRRLRVTLPGGIWTERTYNILGQVTRLTDSTGSAITNSYNVQGQLRWSKTAGGYLTRLEYDAEDRATNTVDANAVGYEHRFDNAGRLTGRRSSQWPVDAPGVWESFGYSPRGLAAYSNQLGHAAYFGYDERGLKIAETNANGEKVNFRYDACGNLTNLIDGKGQNTFWRFDQYGRVTNKTDHAGNVVFDYRYDAMGRLTHRWTPAKGTTAYTYDAVGNLTFINYSNSTDITLSYDDLNRLATMVDAVGTNRYTYTAWGALLSEDGPWDADTVTYAYTSNRLRSQLTLAQPNASAWVQSYAYDKANRLTNTTSPAGAFGYGYRSTTFTEPITIALTTTASRLVERLSLPGGGYIFNDHDVQARLTSTALKNSSDVVLNSHGYQLNDAHQRTRQTRTGGEYADYTYDDIGQLATALGKESGGSTNRWHEQYRYAYDAAGNLSNRVANVLTNVFHVDNLNQLTSVVRTNSSLTVGGHVLGVATSVTVADNGNTPPVAAHRYADGAFARTNVSALDGTNTFVAVAQDADGRTDTNAVTTYLPVATTFLYDLNGNMRTNGSVVYAYDDENQLVAITNAGTWASVFAYDGKLRRRVRREFSWSGGAWVLTNEVRYVYDGNLPIQERDSFNVPKLSLTRGPDLSGSLQGAGGIGGLLARTDNATLTVGGTGAHAYFHADGNGNITALIDAAAAVVAHYLYDPYGNTLSSSGPAAEANLYRFSSKELHLASGLIYYLYRYYAPDLQRWPNRDPLGEYFGSNLYGFAGNTAFNSVDLDGLATLELGVTFDDSIRDRNDANKKLQVLLDDLKARLKSCFDKYTLGRDCKTITATSGSQPKKPPGGYPKSPFPKNPANGKIPIIVTSSPLEKGDDALGRTWEGMGIVLDLTNPTTLSHELGHYGGYNGNHPSSPGHSADIMNLMFTAPWKGQTADRQWCEKVTGLFR